LGRQRLWLDSDVPLGGEAFLIPKVPAAPVAARTGGIGRLVIFVERNAKVIRGFRFIARFGDACHAIPPGASSRHQSYPSSSMVHCKAADIAGARFPRAQAL
jgi:hypothetical protein